MILDLLLTATYIACCAAGLYRGYNKLYIATAILLALSFQYVLGFSDITKIIVAGIMVFYFLLPRKDKKQEEPILKTKTASSQTSEKTEEDIEATFQEFQNFKGGKHQTNNHQQGQYK